MADTRDELVSYIRTDLGDVAETRYTDAEIFSYIDKACNVMIKSRVGMTYFDFASASGVITPDINADTDDNAMIKNMIVFGAEYLVLSQEYWKILRQTISVRDGDSAISLGGSAGGYKDLLSGDGGVGSKFEQAIRAYNTAKNAEAYY